MVGKFLFRDKRFDSERQQGLLFQSNILYTCTYLKYVWKHVILVHRHEVKQGFVSGSEPSLDFPSFTNCPETAFQSGLVIFQAIIPILDPYISFTYMLLSSFI